MRATTLLFSALALLAPARAQYTAGWTPGQPASRGAAVKGSTSSGWAPGAAHATATARVLPSSPRADGPPKEFFERLLTTGPLGALLDRAGVNVSEKLAEQKAKQAAMWDDRVPLLSDYNFESIVVNESLSAAEEAARVWFIIMWVRPQPGGEEGLMDVQHGAGDGRHDEQGRGHPLRRGPQRERRRRRPPARPLRPDRLHERDVPDHQVERLAVRPHVYALAMMLTAHSAPYYVLATDRARTLRFFRAGQMNVDADVLHAFLREQAYLGTPPWSSAFAPGGEREWALERFARASEWVYDRVVLVPRWLFMLVTGTLGTALIQLFHRGEAPDAKAVEEKRRRLLAGQAQAKAREEAAALKAKQEADAAAVKASPAKKRKNAKK
jgi:hypothetical protein